MKNKPLLPFVFRHWENSVGSYLVAFSKILKLRSGFHEVFCKYFTKCWCNHYFPFLKRDCLTRFFLWERVETHILEIVFLLSQFHQSLMGARKEDDGWLFVFFVSTKLHKIKGKLSNPTICIPFHNQLSEWPATFDCIVVSVSIFLQFHNFGIK